MSLATEGLKLCRNVLGRRPVAQPLKIQREGQDASNAIYSAITSPEPCMVSRFGAVELNAVLCSLDSQYSGSAFTKFKRYVEGESGYYWWTSSLKRQMRINAGFFPAQPDWLNRFGQRILDDVGLIDVLGSWRADESRLADYFSEATTVPLNDMFPVGHADPWTTALEGQTVLVVHPFTDSIRQQYQKRERLFQDSRLLPRFHLKTLPAVQSAGGQQTEFATWFDALDSMRNQIADIEFDTAIIGAGAYGMPLAADIKRMGKNAIHLGGITQVMFGVMGNRWEYLSHLFNRYWVRPSLAETPPLANLVEAACYW